MGFLEFGVVGALLVMLVALGWLDVHWKRDGYRFVISGLGLVGGLLPIILLLAAQHAYQAQPSSWRHGYFNPTAYTLCPPCIAGLANLPGVGPAIFLGASIIMANALVGIFVRLGVTRKPAFLAVPIAAGAGMIWWGAMFLN